MAHLWARWLLNHAASGIPSASERGAESEGGYWPTCGQGGYLTLPPRGSPPLQSGGQNQKWPTLRARWLLNPYRRIPSASERGAESEMAHLWARWLLNPCRLGDPLRFRAGGRIRSGTLRARWLLNPCRLGDPLRFRAGGRIRNGQQARWLLNPCRLGRFRARVAHLAGKVAPPPQSGGQNQKWPTCGQGGYLTPAASGIPTASEQNQWLLNPSASLRARWPLNPCRLGDPLRFGAGGRIRNGPLVGKVAT